MYYVAVDQVNEAYMSEQAVKCIKYTQENLNKHVVAWRVGTPLVGIPRGMYNEKMYLGSGITDPADPGHYNVNDPNIIVDKLPLGETSGRVLMT